MIIGVAGGTGSGKTTLAENIARAFGDRVAVITHDSYYRAQNDMSYEERCKQNYDHPDAFETDLLCEHLDALARGEAIDMPVYDYTVYNRSSRTERVEPRAVVILEGILIFCDERLREKMDLKIFVDADADDRLIRVMKRDVVERGRSAEQVIERYQRVLKPMHEQFIEPCKRFADVIVPQGGHNNAAINMLAKFVKQQLRERD